MGFSVRDINISIFSEFILVCVHVDHLVYMFMRDIYHYAITMHLCHEGMAGSCSIACRGFNVFDLIMM